jgi:hypothetical protein
MQSFFTDVSYLLRDNPSGLNYGAAVSDLDGDGRFEVFVTGFSGASTVWKWTGDEYINIADATLANIGRRAIGVAAGDMDGDGREELYVLNTDTFMGRKRTGDRLFKWVRSGWLDLFELPDNTTVQNLYAGRSVGCVDRLGNGKYGFFVANYGGPMRLFELLDNSFELIDAAPELGLNFNTGGRAVLPAPLVSKRTDIFLNNENSRNYLLVNQGDGTFRDMADHLGLSDPFEHGRGAATFDADGDGRLDLLVGNWEGPHRLYIQNATGLFIDVAPPELAVPSKVRTVIAADFDNDGYDELFFNNIGEPNRLFGWRSGRWTSLHMGDAQERDGAGTGAAVGDFNGDGYLELLITHGEMVLQPLTLYAPRPNANNWIRILPRTRYGAPARGSVVRIEAGGRVQTKLIDAGSGYLCQMEPVAHFGLGAVNTVDYAEVQYPDGTLQVLPTLAVNQVHEIDQDRSR